MAFSRDFPPGFGTNSISTSFAPKSSHSYSRDFPHGCGSNAPKSTHIYPDKRSLSGKDSGSFTDSTDWRRSVAALKTKPPLSGKMEMKTPQNLKGKEPIETGAREKVLEMMRLFRERCEKISREEKGVKRVDVKASSELKEERKIINQPALIIGSVPGVEIGDKFYYRVELVIVGLHRLLQGGIDQMESGRGKLATCIVANERHLDKMNDPNVLTYVGEGGVLPRHEVGVPPDQQLKGGNLALWSSMKEKKPVRVVRGLSYGAQKIMYVYDGLYEVSDCEKKRGPLGNMIFEFRLIRCPGQPAVPWRECRKI